MLLLSTLTRKTASPVSGCPARLVPVKVIVWLAPRALAAGAGEAAPGWPIVTPSNIPSVPDRACPRSARYWLASAAANA
jgi:hypothetical protein